MKDEFIYQIMAMYHITGSLRKTADEMGLSLSTIRKALITYGAYSTPFSDEVFSLHCKGCSVEDIAQTLNTTVKRVTAWLPYEKGMYNTAEKTHDAVRCDNYRKRIKQAQINSVQNKIKNDKNEIFNIINNNRISTSPTDTILKETDQPSNPIRLHLKLENKYADSESKRILRKYGRSSTGTSIERDILIPSDMTLHALHYAIQRLYG